MGPEDQTRVVSLGDKHLYPRTVSILEFLWLGQLFKMELFLVGENDVDRRFARVEMVFVCILGSFLDIRTGLVTLCKGQDSKCSRLVGQ